MLPKVINVSLNISMGVPFLCVLEFGMPINLIKDWGRSFKMKVQKSLGKQMAFIELHSRVTGRHMNEQGVEGVIFGSAAQREKAGCSKRNGCLHRKHKHTIPVC